MMLITTLEPEIDFGRGGYDTTGVPKPPPPKNTTVQPEIDFGRGSYDTTGTPKPKHPQK